MHTVCHRYQLTWHSPPALPFFDKGFQWQTSCSGNGAICIAGLNCSVHLHSRPVWSCQVLLEALKHSTVIRNWLWKLILHKCMLPVTNSRGWSRGWPIVISLSHQSPSSHLVLLSHFPKNPFISALPQLRACFCCSVPPVLSGGCCQVVSVCFL